MKSYYSMLVVFLMAVMLLAACSDTAVEEVEPAEAEAEEPAEETATEPTEDEKAAEEEAAKAAKEAEEAEAAAKEAEEAAAELAAEEAEAENLAAAEELEKQDAYTSKMYELTGDLSSQLSTIGDLSIQAGDDPYLMFDQEWITDYAMELVMMDITIDQVREQEPPEHMQEAHNTVLLAMDEFEFVVDNMPSAIDNLDDALIEECTVAISNGSDYFLEATAQIEALQ